MAYTLKEFCADHHALLTSGQPLAEALPQIAEKLSALLRNPEFVAESFNDDTPPGKRTLHHDADTDVYVLAHVYEGPKKGSPHSHGASWAVYGTARAVTEMTEWRRINPESEEQAVLEPVANYEPRPRRHPRLRAGRAALHAASREGLGDPRHRHRSRRHPALPLPAEDRQDHREGVSALYFFSILVEAVDRRPSASPRRVSAGLRMASPSIGLIVESELPASSRKAWSRHIAMKADCSALARSGGHPAALRTAAP